MYISIIIELNFRIKFNSINKICECIIKINKKPNNKLAKKGKKQKKQEIPKFKPNLSSKVLTKRKESIIIPVQFD